MSYNFDLQDKDLNDPILNLCNDLMKNTYNTAEFKERMHYVLPSLYEQLKNTIKYFFKLIVTDTFVDSIDNYRAHITQYNRIKDFVIFFGEVIYYFEDLAKLDYFLLMDKRFSKAAGDVFDQENKYRFTIKGFEMCIFAKLFFKIEEFSSSFRKFYEDCYYSHGNEEFSVYSKIFCLLDTSLSTRN